MAEVGPLAQRILERENRKPAETSIRFLQFRLHDFGPLGLVALPPNCHLLATTVSNPASRKSFLSKLALCAVAIGTMPGLLVRRLAGGGAGSSAAEPATGAADAPVIALRTDTRAIERDLSAS